MRAIFISDAHLRRANDERYGKLINFFNDIKEGNVHRLVDSNKNETVPLYIDDLYIAGDLFDFWFCQKENIYPEFIPVIHKLIELQKTGIRIHLSEGNHDFFMGEYFRDVLGMEVFEEMMNVRLDDLRVLIAHGDTTDSTNIKYILFRKFLRSPAFYNIQRFIPASIRWAMAGFSSTASKEVTMEDGDALVKKMLSFARDKLQGDYDAVILGHCHVPSINRYTIAEKKKTFVTLGDWINHYSFLYYEDNDFFLGYYKRCFL
jgi:UDP-2,3-diacylglucosamine hydrolase